jgi:prepilin-type N-terminal cleavage/methylation domain-containing protein
MRTRGFTIVEVIVTITIMGILLTLAVVGVGATQMNARDNERRADVEAIATHLESFFKTGTDGSTNYNRYPNANLITSTANIETALRDIDLESVMAPGIDDPMQTMVIATNTAQTVAGVLPQPTKDQYVYQPMKSDGTLCLTGDIDCRKFNLYYRLEGDNTVYMVTSKNQ